jgi:hypothetical protein
MNDNKDYTLKVVDIDDCPLNDNPIINKECANCEHYKGFEVSNGQRCIKCSYYNDISKN